MNHLTRADYAGALALLARLESAALQPLTFACAAVVAIGDYVVCDPPVTLGVCDPATRLPLEHAIAVPLYRDGGVLVGLVLRRRHGPGFSERDRERLELVRPHLAFLYGLTRQRATAATDAAPAFCDLLDLRAPAPAPRPDVLTPREGEVMHWLSRGKTDADIAALLSLSTRTVHKHLEHIYVKLGVETRTAAVVKVMRAWG